MPSSAQKQAIILKAKLFRGFSDPSRLLILETLRQGPLTVTELVSATGLSQSNASNHLGCLRDCGLVSVEPQGRFARYQLNGQIVDNLLGLAGDLLEETARQVYECAHYAVGELSDEPAANH